jgi:hypothetical protein
MDCRVRMVRFASGRVARRLGTVAWFRRGAKSQGPTIDRDAHRGDMDDLERFVQTRQGVEAYLEPRTMMTQTTLMLIAHDGAWTRRRVPSPDAARRWARGLNVPFYEVALVGYPQRMRDYNARQKRTAS